jgi:hypothetical protein
VAVRRDDAIVFDERPLDERLDRTFPVQMKQQQASDAARSYFQHDDLGAIRRHRERTLLVRASRQPLGRAGTVCRLPIEIRETGRTVASRPEDDAPAVGRPDREDSADWILGDPRQRLVHEIPRPDVDVLIADS